MIRKIEDNPFITSELLEDICLLENIYSDYLVRRLDKMIMDDIKRDVTKPVNVPVVTSRLSISQLKI